MRARVPDLNIIVVAGMFLLAAGAATRVRLPIGPGVWYPADAANLRAAIESYINDADFVELPGRLVAAIVPHSSLPFFGNVAGHAFKLVRPGDYDRVVILAPSHHGSIRGCSIPTVDAYVTPLGAVPLDGASIQRLAFSPLISLRSVTHNPRRLRDPEVRAQAIHELEHAIEVLLPFLQVQLGEFKLIPILVGEIRDYYGKPDGYGMTTVAELIRSVIDERTLIIVSSNFTCYGDVYGYRPFEDDVAARIEELDQRALDFTLHRNRAGFFQYLEETRNPICGAYAIGVLMELLAKGTGGMILEYDTSSRITGNLDTSVSFAAVAFFDPRRPVPVSGAQSSLSTSPEAGQVPGHLRPVSEVDQAVPQHHREGPYDVGRE